MGYITCSFDDGEEHNEVVISGRPDLIRSLAPRGGHTGALIQGQPLDFEKWENSDVKDFNVLPVRGDGNCLIYSLIFGVDVAITRPMREQLKRARNQQTFDNICREFVNKLFDNCTPYQAAILPLIR